MEGYPLNSSIDCIDIEPIEKEEVYKLFQTVKFLARMGHTLCFHGAHVLSELITPFNKNAPNSCSIPPWWKEITIAVINKNKASNVLVKQFRSNSSNSTLFEAH